MRFFPQITILFLCYPLYKHTHAHTSYVHTNKLLLVSRYFNSLGIGAADEWGKSINEFIVNHNLTYSTSIQYVVENIESSQITLTQQFQVISALPNFHHWMADRDNGVKNNGYFFDQGKSPRHLIIS